MAALVVSLSAQGISIGSGTIFSLGSATLTLPNNWSNSGTFQAQDGTVVLNGSSGNQTIANSSGETFNNLIVNKSSGDVQLLDSMLITGTLTLTSGDLNINNKVLRLGSNAALSETPGNTIKDGIAYCTKTLTAPTSVNIMGAEITSGANLGSTDVVRGQTAQMINSYQGIQRYYDIAPTTNSGLNATLVFHYDDSELNGLNESDLDIYRYNTATSSWENLGGTLDMVANTVSLTNIDHFSRWTLGASASYSSDSLFLSPGWNLVSIPRILLNYQPGYVFPHKSGSIYAYNTSLRLYNTASILANGPGYWVNNSITDTTIISGLTTGSLIDTAAQTGWVLIGSRDTSIQVSSLVFSNGAYKSGSVFRYDASPGQRQYVKTTVINPGEAVWINVQGATSWPCTITIP